MLALADGKTTKDPLLSQILFARTVNHYLGVQIWPADVEDLPDDFIDAINGLIGKLPKYQAHEKEVDAIFEKWRNGHPTYGKR